MCDKEFKSLMKGLQTIMTYNNIQCYIIASLLDSIYSRHPKYKDI